MTEVAKAAATCAAEKVEVADAKAGCAMCAKKAAEVAAVAEASAPRS